MAGFQLHNLLFPILTVTGAYAVIGLGLHNGYWQMLEAHNTAPGPLKLPGTGELVRTSYTGIAGLDKQLVTLMVFFWPCATAELPALSLYAVYMAAQLIPMQTLLILEGLRYGNRGKTIS
jgi:hypothetical protein